ncbi:MAG: SPW repeat protein [Bacillota bacterium]
MRDRRAVVQTASGFVVVVGIWLMVSPVVLSFPEHSARAHNVILGIVIGVIAAVRVLFAHEHPALSWVNVALGVWVLSSPWILGYASNVVPTTNNVIAGILVTVLATWSALASMPTGRRDERDDYSDFGGTI